MWLFSLFFIIIIFGLFSYIIQDTILFMLLCVLLEKKNANICPKHAPPCIGNLAKWGKNPEEVNIYLSPLQQKKIILKEVTCNFAFLTFFAFFCVAYFGVLCWMPPPHSINQRS